MNDTNTKHSPDFLIDLGHGCSVFRLNGVVRLVGDPESVALARLRQRVAQGPLLKEALEEYEARMKP
jgi:hypothetical protein